MSVLSWNTPTTISGFTASEPRAVIDSNGNATAIWIEQSTYNTGTVSQSGTTVTGTGTTFTNSMIGGTIVFANNVKANIVAFGSATSLTTSQSLTVSSQAYVIYYNGTIRSSTLPNGGSWGSSVQLSTSGNNSLMPRIGIDSNSIVSTVWAENTSIKYASYNGSWSSVTTLSTGTGASNPSMAIDNSGNIVVVWTKTNNTEAITKPISTGVWSSVTTFTTANSDNPTVALGNGVTTIVWHAKPTTQDQIIASVSSTIGGAYSTPVNITGLTGAGHMHNYPKISVDPFGNSLVVWFRSDMGGSSGTDYINVAVLASVLVSGSTSWSIPVAISNIGMRNPSDLILRNSYDPSGNAYVLWTTSTLGNLYTIQSIIRQIGGNLSNVYSIVTDNLTASDVSFSISPLSDVLVLYMYFDGTNSTIQQAETDVGGAPLNFYTPSTTISATGTNNAHPKGYVSLNGNTVNAVAVWQNYDTTNNTTVIHASSGTKSLLLAPTGLGVTQSTNNFGAFNEYENTISWTASSDPNVIGYNIYRDSIFFSQVGSGITQIVDTNCPQSGTGTTITYSVASLDVSFQQSRRINVSIS